MAALDIQQKKPRLTSSFLRSNSQPFFFHHHGQFQPVHCCYRSTSYYLWQSTIYSAFETFDLEGHLDGANAPSATILTTTEGTSESTPNPAFTAWKKRDKILFLWLKPTMSHSILPYIMHIRTTREAWSYLSNLYQSQSRARVMQLRYQLQTTTKVYSTMMDYIDKKRAISHSLALASHPITDEELMSAILFGLDSSYFPFRSAINPQLDHLTIDSLHGLMLQEEEKLTEETKSIQLQANVIYRQYSNHFPTNGYPNQQSFTASKKTPVVQPTTIPLVLLVNHLLVLSI